MKRILSILFVLAVMTGGIIHAQDDTPPAGVFALATLVPADSISYIGLKIDDATIAEIDGLLARVAGLAAQFGAPAPEVPTVRSVLASGAVTPETVDMFLAGAGDTMGYSVNGPNAVSPDLGLVFISVDDRALIGKALAGLGFAEGEARGSYAVFSNGTQTALLNDTIMIVGAGTAGGSLDLMVGGDYPRLTRDASFSAGLGGLPVSDYGLGLFTRGSTFNQTAGMPVPVESVMAGAVLLDGDTLTIDVVLSGPAIGRSAGAVDPTFRRFVPAGATALIHSAGLGTNLTMLIDYLPVLSGSGVNPREQVSGLMSGFGLDLDELLAWTAGDFAVFGRVDMAALVQGGMASPMDNAMVEGAIGFGAAIETDNPEATQRFQLAVASLFRLMANQVPGMTLGEEEISGVTAGVVTIQAEGISSGLTFKLAFAATDEVFVIGTYDMVAASLRQSDGFESSTLVLDASRYWLADASSVALVDGATLLQFGAFGSLVVLGPAIGNVFASITDSLEGNAPQPTPTPSLGAFSSPEQLAALLEQLSSIFRHATISGRPTDAGIVLRATITLGE